MIPLWWFLQHLVTTALLIACVGAVCQFLRHRPAVQHALWVVVLIKFCVPPLFVWPWSLTEIGRPFIHLLGERSAAFYAQEGQRSGGREINFPAASSDLPQHSFAFAGDNSSFLAVGMLSQQTAKTGAALSSLDVSLATSVVLLTVWAIGCWVHVRRQLDALRRYWGVVQRGTAAPQVLIDEIDAVARQLDVRPVRALLVPEITTPFIWCLGRMRLLWPKALANQSEITRSRSVVAHELAHVRRRDHWVAWAELVAGIVWWWNPLFWYVRNRLHETAEEACDAVALGLGAANRREYAELLLELSAVSKTGAPAPVLGVSTGTHYSLERRICMILSDSVTGKLSAREIVAAGCLAFVAYPCWSYGEQQAAPDSQPTPAEVQIEHGTLFLTRTDLVEKTKTRAVEAPPALSMPVPEKTKTRTGPVVLSLSVREDEPKPGPGEAGKPDTLTMPVPEKTQTRTVPMVLGLSVPADESKADAAGKPQALGIPVPVQTKKIRARMGEAGAGTGAVETPPVQMIPVPEKTKTRPVPLPVRARGRAAKTQTQAVEVEQILEESVQRMRWSADGNVMASVSTREVQKDGRNVRLHTFRAWDARTGEIKHSFEEAEYPGFMWFDLSPDGKLLAISQRGRVEEGDKIRLFDTADGTPRQTIEIEYGRSRAWFVFSPDGKSVAVCGSELEDDKLIGVVRIYSLDTVRHRQKLLGHGSEIISMAYSPDGKWLAAGCKGGEITLWQSDNGSVKQTLKAPAAVAALAVSPDGKQIVSSGTDTPALVWDVATGTSRELQHQGDKGTQNVALSSDGRYLASDGWVKENGETKWGLRIWNAANGDLLHEGTAARGFMFKPNSKGLMSLRGDNTVKLWQIDEK